MNSGITRRIDELGRIVIPVETRRLFGITEGDQLSFLVEGDAILIRKLEATCAFCGSTSNVSPFKERGVCQSCSSELRSTTIP